MYKNQRNNEGELNIIELLSLLVKDYKLIFSVMAVITSLVMSYFTITPRQQELTAYFAPTSDVLTSGYVNYFVQTTATAREIRVDQNIYRKTGLYFQSDGVLAITSADEDELANFASVNEKLLAEANGLASQSVESLSKFLGPGYDKFMQLNFTDLVLLAKLMDDDYKFDRENLISVTISESNYLYPKKVIFAISIVGSLLIGMFVSLIRFSISR